MRFLGALLTVALLWAATPMPEAPTEVRGTSCQRRARAARARVTAAQRRAIRRRHVRAPIAEVRRWAAMTPPPLDFRVAGAASPFVLTPLDDAGAFDAAALQTARAAFAYRVDGATHEVHPRLLALVYAAVRHFRVPYVNVVSGYRSGNPSSRHGQGRALDFALPGVTDTRLAAWLRPQGFVGVGIYPNSGFVHLDVRARSYFWRDASGPDQRGRERPILRALGPRYDHAARARGIEPVADVPEVPAESESDDDASSDGSATAPEVEVEVLVGDDRDAGAPR